MIALYTKYKKPIIIVVVCLIVLALVWFVWREVEGIKKENSAERELLIQQRVDAIRALRVRDSIALAKEDSLIMEILGIKTRVEYKIIEREKYIKVYLDTASIRTKHMYLDSLFGPK